jgi:hypothetical protein
MDRYSVVIALGLLCFVAATCTTGSAEDMLQNRFAIEGSVHHLRGMMAMRDASSMRVESKLLEGLKTDISPEQMLDIFRTVQSQRKQNSRLDSLYPSELDKLIYFADDDGENCFLSQVQVFLHVNQIGQSPQPLLKEYMNHYGARKFRHCAKQGLQILKEQPKGEFEEDLDKFFTILLGLSEGEGDKKLWANLRRANLLKDELNFSEALESQIKVEDFEKAECSSVRILRHLRRSCNELARYSSKTYLDSIILSVAWQGRPKLDDRTRKLIEYQNVCWYVLEYPSRLAENASLQLGWLVTLRELVALCDDDYLEILERKPSPRTVEI